MKKIEMLGLVWCGFFHVSAQVLLIDSNVKVPDHPRLLMNSQEETLIRKHGQQTLRQWTLMHPIPERPGSDMKSGFRLVRKRLLTYSFSGRKQNCRMSS